MDILNQISSNPFFEISAILILAALFGAVGRLLKQPLIVAFIALGIIVGPSVLNIIHSQEKIHFLAEMGIAILLFVVGLKLDLNLIKSTGGVALSTGLGQVLFTSLFGYLISIGLGYPPIPSLYIAIALTFSSTIIIVKLLSDKKEIDALHGQIAIGFLIVQDIVVVLIMIVLSAVGRGTGAENNLTWTIIGVISKGALMVTITGLMMRFILPRLTEYLAKSSELLVLFSIAWAVALASASEMMGFSREVGAFLAGVSLASTPYREVISGRLVSLRDFLLLFFFIHLGSTLDLSLLRGQVAPSFVFSVFVLVGNPLIVMMIMGLMGYRKRTGFLAGLTVAQISEFSLIFAALGLTLGHIDEETVGLITLVGLITIGLSTYMILYSYPLFEKLAPMLSIFEKKNPFREARMLQNEEKKIDAIVFGLGRYGGSIANSLKKEGLTVMGIDFDPGSVEKWNKAGGYAQYGDLEDPELPEQLPLKHAKYLISSLPEVQANLALLKCMKNYGFNGRIILTAHNIENASLLDQEGADLILMPFADAAETVMNKLKLLEESTDSK